MQGYFVVSGVVRELLFDPAAVFFSASVDRYKIIFWMWPFNARACASVSGDFAASARTVDSLKDGNPPGTSSETKVSVFNLAPVDS